MNEFALQITNGCKESDIDEEYIDAFENLKKIEAIKEENDGLFRLSSLYRIGELYINKDGTGFIESILKSEIDLLIEPENLKNSKRGDLVVAKRIIAKRGRPSGKIILIAKKAFLYNLAYINIDESKNFSILDMRTNEPLSAWMGGLDLKTLKSGTILKIDIDNNEVKEILGNLDDPKIDEKISLILYDREDEFPVSCLEQASTTPLKVDGDEYPNRIDLRNLDFCTIDPVTAKDFDDAIYFDTDNFILYVAIADVSYYVDYFSPIDLEAKKRGFTTYLPHKAFPMLPRELSENICSLKPRVDRLAFVSKIMLDKNTLMPKNEEFFEAVIHSKHRFNYDEIDKLIETNGAGASGVVKRLWTNLSKLYNITKSLKAKRLKNGFDFRTEEMKLSIDKNHLLKSTQIETGTPAHSLIEECMLLANQASAKRAAGEEWIFRIHEPPQISKLEELLAQLAAIGLFVDDYEDSPSLIRAIQKEAVKLGLENEVDSMIIKSLKQASYAPQNLGHFGLGFTHYSHFTSPIRRYSDLILHRLIKTQLNSDAKEKEYLLRNISPLCARVSELERKTTKCEWDFRDRKFARWAATHIDKIFEAEIIEIQDNNAKAVLKTDVSGVVVNLKNDNLLLFDRVEVSIYEVNIAMAIIMAKVIRKLSKEPMEL
ncbi:MAG: VacB/RNase II family 3'-5' exoribonuclease [Epsilonproteobacteria bacterium]|nr:VacB/RNase II family 3'-5' exoribonuclease [Campylobacterota bacterium]